MIKNVLHDMHYDFKVYDSIKEMVNDIKKKNTPCNDRSRLLSGYTKDHN